MEMPNVYTDNALKFLNYNFNGKEKKIISVTFVDDLYMGVHDQYNKFIFILKACIFQLLLFVLLILERKSKYIKGQERKEKLWHDTKSY